jgi:hypothetical protein
LPDWLGIVLAPAEIPVRHHDADPSFPISQAWLPASWVATRWHVPVTEVATLADRYGVHTGSGPHTGLYNAYDAETCAEQARAMTDQQEPH